MRVSLRRLHGNEVGNEEAKDVGELETDTTGTLRYLTSLKVSILF